VPKARARRRLIFDLETSQVPALVFSTGKQYVAHEQLLGAPKIICVAWMWHGGKRVYSATWDYKEGSIYDIDGLHCDKRLLEEFIPVMESADELCYQNGDRFDQGWVRARCIKHGIPLRPNFAAVDTLKLARKYLRLPSYRLDYLGYYFCNERKKKTDRELWKSVYLGNKSALKEMVDYCKQDVLLTGKVWDKLDPYVPTKTALLPRGHGICCPKCGKSEYLRASHRRQYTPAGYAKITFKCWRPDEGGVKGVCGKHDTVVASRWDEFHALREENRRLGLEVKP